MCVTMLPGEAFLTGILNKNLRAFNAVDPLFTLHSTLRESLPPGETLHVPISISLPRPLVVGRAHHARQH